jgi:hypothetical protein
MAKPKKPQPTISTYRPGIVEKVSDATIGALVRQASRATGASERQANSYSQDALNNIETLTGLKSLEGSIRRSLKGKGSVGDYVATGLTAVPFVGRLPIVRRGARAVDEALMGQRVTNHVVPKPNASLKPTILDRRPLTSPEQVTHASRNISAAELKDAIKRKQFAVPSEGTKFNKTGEKDKWWSAADEKGTFGRPWKSSQPHRVRVPIDKIPKGRAVSIKHAEVLDPATNSWKPIPRKANGGEINASRANVATPVKKAAGGVAKVRKGMATPEGKIIDAMNKIRGK